MKDSIPSFDPRSEPALLSFALEFVERHGPDSVFATSLSDLWTTAMGRGGVALGWMEDTSEIVLLSDARAVEVLGNLLRRSECLKKALFQEPFGFVAAGAIELAFDQTFGAGVYEPWLEAFEKKDFDCCTRLINQPKST